VRPVRSAINCPGIRWPRYGWQAGVVWQLRGANQLENRNAVGEHSFSSMASRLDGICRWNVWPYPGRSRNFPDLPKYAPEVAEAVRNRPGGFPMIIEVDDREVKAFLKKLGSLTAQDKALYRTLGKTNKTTKTQAAKSVGKSLALKAGRIKKDMKTLGPHKGDLTARLRTKSRPVGYLQFGAKQKKGGVSVKVLRKGGRRFIPHAFIAKMPNNEQIVAIRKTPQRFTEPNRPEINYAQLPKAYRYPIKTLYGPRIADWLARAEVMDPLQRDVGQILIDNLDREVMAILRGY